MLKTFVKFAKNESGATAIEYGLIASLIALVIIGGLTAVGTSLSSTFSTISGSLK
jgi:pilus assembly protein Flp/PilA